MGTSRGISRDDPGIRFLGDFGMKNTIFGENFDIFEDLEGTEHYVDT